MISKHLLWLIGLAVLALIALSFWGGSYPARVTVMNASGEMATHAVLESGGQRVELPSIGNGSAKTVQLDPGEPVTLRYRARVWRSEGKLQPAESMVLWLRPDRIEMQERVGRKK